METKNNNQQVIDLGKVFRILWSKKALFVKMWVCVFVLSCIWILPQPRFYTAEVKLAPEMNGEDVAGGLSSIASSFGFNIGGIGGQDAIYPELYPELFGSPEFLVGLFGIKITTADGALTTDYFTYMKKHQKKNMLTQPFLRLMRFVKSLFEKKDNTPSAGSVSGINPFWMSKKDYAVMFKIMKNISCSVDKKTSVVSIKVTDQDPLICATIADSVKLHLQNFIIRYRTSKVIEDVRHYQEMRDSAETEYNNAMRAYGKYSDAHKNVTLQTYKSELEKMEVDLGVKQNALTAMETQLQATKVKLQEKTPAFTTLQSATVPFKPAGPKRVVFVIMMLILSSIALSVWLTRKDIF